MVMKKIFDGVFDDEVHNSFLKFGRGEYKDKFLLEGKKQASKWAIKTGPEYANALVRSCLLKASNPVLIDGIIVSTSDLRDEISFSIQKVSNFQGVRKHVIKAEVDPQAVLDLMDTHPRTFFGLSLKGDDFVLKVKKKAPTSGKPGKEKEGGPTADFCSLKTTDKDLVDRLFFDDSSFKETKVSHTIMVDNIVYPSNMDSLSPKEVREQAKRQGVIHRKVVTDGEEKVVEAKFTA
jgi:hypothetical protein